MPNDFKTGDYFTDDGPVYGDMFVHQPHERRFRIIPRFFRVPHTGPDGTVTDLEMVELLMPGDLKSAPVHRVTDELRKRHHEAYGAFLRGEQLDMTGGGTALTNWQPLQARPGLVKVFHHHNIYSVEALAEVPDSNLPNLGIDSRRYRDGARAFIEAKTTSAPIDALQGDLKNERDANEVLRRQLVELEEKVEQMANKAAGVGIVEADDGNAQLIRSTVEPKRGPGRSPTKVR